MKTEVDSGVTENCNLRSASDRIVGEDDLRTKAASGATVSNNHGRIHGGGVGKL